MHLSRSPLCEDEPVGSETQRNIAAIDIGTSSVHLAIARPPIASGAPEILLRQKSRFSLQCMFQVSQK